jgi:hypothetical protein
MVPPGQRLGDSRRFMVENPIHRYSFGGSRSKFGWRHSATDNPFAFPSFHYLHLLLIAAEIPLVAMTTMG